MRRLRVLFFAALAALTLDLLVLTIDWITVPHLEAGPVPPSRFIRSYVAHRLSRGWPPLRWRPVALSQISRPLRTAVVLGEDATFFRNDGFDWAAILWAARTDWRARRIIYGASTLTQQTAKNLFLTPSRTFFRKANEAVLTVALTHFLTKDRILELYLDDAQFGRGIYGAEAAAHYYFAKPARNLDRREAAELAATLPDPLHGNPRTPDLYFRRRTAKILRLLRTAGRRA